MASVALETVLLAAHGDLSAQVELDVESLTERDGVDGDVRSYANGRRRSVTTAARKRTVPIRFDIVADRALLEMVRSWQGRLILLRDPRGRKVWGVFYDLEIDENVAVDVASVSLTVTEVSHDEAV